ncbi:MAG TPA: hypothetical protein VF266_25340 [Thermoanaerobaculia bacterium]
MRTLLLLVLLAVPVDAATRHNDDSCDIAALPAATLLLPYFEVDPHGDGGTTTRFSITNVTNVPRVAHVTLWTDRAYPVIGFNIYLSGYDLQVIDLFDVIRRGVVAPPNGTGTAPRPRGSYSDPNGQLEGAACASLPGALPAEYVGRMYEAFTSGFVRQFRELEECGQVGSQHDNAIGYATIDVIGTCAPTSVAESEYWTRHLRYDNVLAGDYEIVTPDREVAQGGPLVHIRAIPEGGTPEQRRAAPVTFDAGFARTFYSRHQPADAPRLDGRQPLPARFAPRWIQGGPNQFRTSLKIWRESAVRADAPCQAFARNDDLAATEIVRFDENENAAGAVPISRPIITDPPRSALDATSMTSVSDDSVYPQLTNGATGGWFLLNLDGARDDGELSQSWVISTMAAGDGFSTDTEAPALDNGCAPEARVSVITAAGGARIEPEGGDDSCDLALLPAATLLVPHFRVDLEPARSETTLFSVTNTSGEERIARVTLWTDYAFPVLTFNVRLTGYDVQSIDLYDVIARGVIAGGSCDLTGPLGEEWIAWMRSAFTEGSVPDFGLREGCGEVGLEHTLAAGYATIDLVRNCASTPPTETSYWSRDLDFDNVLIGDYQFVRPAQSSADGAPMVHIRAVPGVELPRTFYGRFQSKSAPRRDARQPLPSTFAVRWSTDFADTHMIMDIWREGATRGDAGCAELPRNLMPSVSIVKFDDRENFIADDGICRHPICEELTFTLPATSRTNILDTTIYPILTNGARDGWLYFNLDRPGDEEAAQAWVVASQWTRGKTSLRRDATALGNGCSPPVGKSVQANGTAIIGPAPNRNP